MASGRIFRIFSRHQPPSVALANLLWINKVKTKEGEESTYLGCVDDVDLPSMLPCQCALGAIPGTKDNIQN